MARLEELYLQRASTARRLLPELCGGSRVDWAKPLEFLQGHRRGLPGQVLPAGWLMDQPQTPTDDRESGPAGIQPL